MRRPATQEGATDGRAGRLGGRPLGAAVHRQRRHRGRLRPGHRRRRELGRLVRRLGGRRLRARGARPRRPRRRAATARAASTSPRPRSTTTSPSSSSSRTSTRCGPLTPARSPASTTRCPTSTRRAAASRCRSSGSRLVGVLRVPAGDGPHPVVVLIPGLDSTKEELRSTEADVPRPRARDLRDRRPGAGRGGVRPADPRRLAPGRRDAVGRPRRAARARPRPARRLGRQPRWLLRAPGRGRPR